MQDCFIKLWDDDAFCENPETVKSFLYTMVRNRCIDYLRKEKLVIKARNYIQSNEEQPEFFDELAFAEMIRLVLDRLKELPSNLSAVISEYYFENKKLKTIAEDLSTTPNAVKLQKSRAIKLLKQKLLSVLYLMFTFL